MKQFMRLFGSVFGVALTGGLCACSVLTSSVSFNQRLMVKVRSDLRPDEMVPAARLADADAWHFRHAVEAPRNPEDRGDWYVAWRAKDLERNRPLSLKQLFSRRWQWARAAAPSLADATHRAFGVYPLMIEPNLVFYGNTTQHSRDNKFTEELRAPARAGQDYQPVWFREQGAGLGARSTSPKVVYLNGAPSAAWPVPNGAADKFWYQNPSYSQLAAARARVMGGHKGEWQVRVGILDTGFDDRHVASPLYVDESRMADADGWVHGWPQTQLWIPGEAERRSPGANPSHGMGTIGLLAGREIILKTPGAAGGTENPVWLGGVPLARVVPVRVASDPVSLGTAALAYGIDYASRVEHCDVISMSHGGSPTQTWVDAVNAAYERGTAMFAAEGDFFSLLPYGWRPTGFIVPASPVYPAAFRRVIGVTGVTSEEKTYSGNSLGRLFRRLKLIADWGFRGSYGPDGWFAGLNPRVNVDEVEAESGELRPYPIAAYTPNVPWLSGTDGVSLSGSGTSAATPQVAAAAALWLENHRREFVHGDWNSWRKAEAVYDALLISAKRKNGQDKPDLYLGAGMLKAGDALNHDYAGVRNLQSKALRYRRVAPDEFSGDESFWRLLFRIPANVPASERAQLDQSDLPKDASREQALARIYYNMLLLQKWHGGSLPTHGAAEDGLKSKASRLAKETKSAS
jgi:subtilisin family serine protease